MRTSKKMKKQAKRAIKVLGVARVNDELTYLIQFNDANEPIFMNGPESRIWSEIIFDFLMEKLMYDGFDDANGSSKNMPILNSTHLSIGQPEIIYVTDVMGPTNFLLKYENGFKFVTADEVKANFIELAVVYLETQIKIE